MKQTLALGALAVAGALSWGGAALAQEAAKAAEPKSPRIAVIDMGEVSEKSLLGKSYKAELEKLRDEIEAARKKTEVERWSRPSRRALPRAASARPWARTARWSCAA